MATDAPEQVTRTRAEVEANIREVNDEAKRMPEHWVERRAGMHERINFLLTMREKAPE